jgi:hypothetical protein
MIDIFLIHDDEGAYQLVHVVKVDLREEVEEVAAPREENVVFMSGCGLWSV